MKPPSSVTVSSNYNSYSAANCIETIGQFGLDDSNEPEKFENLVIFKKVEPISHKELMWNFLDLITAVNDPSEI